MTPIRGSLRRRLVRVVVLTGLVVATTACADKDTVADAPEIPGPAYSGTVRVSALDNIYRPEALKVVTDTEVVWSNDGRNDHNVIPNESKDDFGVETADFAPGKEHSATDVVEG